MPPTSLLYRIRSSISQFAKGDGWYPVFFRNVLWSGSSVGVTRLLRVATILIMARWLGPDGYGSFAYVFSFAAMFAVLFDLGMAVHITKEFAAHPDMEKTLPDYLLLKFILGVFGILILALAVRMIGGTARDSLVMIAVMGGYFFCQELLNMLHAVFRARLSFNLDFFLSLISSALILMCVLATVWAGFKGPQSMVTAHLVAALAAALGALVLVLGRLDLFAGGVVLQPDTWVATLKKTVPLAAIGGLSTIYAQMDVVMLGGHGLITETGIYSSALRVAHLFTLPMVIIYSVTLPTFSAEREKKNSVFQVKWKQWIRAMLVCGLIFTIIPFIFAEEIIWLLFGEEFQDAGNILRLLVFLIIALYLFPPLAQTLIIFGKIKTLLTISLVAVPLNMALNAALIPLYSMYGAAIATLSTYVFVLIVTLVIIVRDNQLPNIDKDIFRMLFAVIGILTSLVSVWAWLH